MLLRAPSIVACQPTHHGASTVRCQLCVILVAVDCRLCAVPKHWLLAIVDDGLVVDRTSAVTHITS